MPLEVVSQEAEINGFGFAEIESGQALQVVRRWFGVISRVKGYCISDRSRVSFEAMLSSSVLSVENVHLIVLPIAFQAEQSEPPVHE